MIKCMISTKSVRDLIKDLNQTDETESLEAKKGSEAGKSLMESICSLSNEPNLSGGTILLGVEKEEFSLFPIFIATGVKNIDKVVTDIGSQVSSVFNFPIRVDISQEMVDGKCVIRIDVPELPASQKPLYIKSQGLPRGAYRRVGSTDQHCTDDDLSVFYQTRTIETPDKNIVEGADWSDIDPDAITAYRKARAEANPLAEELTWSDSDLLQALNCIALRGDGTALTLAGLISFGKAASLRRLDPSCRVEYIRVPGKTWVADPDNRFESIEFRGPTLRLIGRVISSILDDLPKAFRLEDGKAQRTDSPLIPERVIREAVVNAIAHRNYQVHSPIQIIRYSNRLEMRNPGYSLKSQERFDEPGSTLRNPHIAEILHETRYAETKGSGIRVMRQKMREMGLTEPTFISSREDDAFSAILLFHHFLSEDDWSWLSMFNEFALDDEQLRALIYLREMGAIDNACYRNLNQVDTLAASNSLRKMSKVGLVESKGSGSRTYYVPGPRFSEINAQASMHASVASIHARPTEMVTPPSAPLPKVLLTRITALGKRIEPEVMEQIIMEICKLQPTSAEDIAKLVGKTKSYITNKYLYKMVRDGHLKYSIPEMVKHPAQKYTAAHVD